MPSKFPRAGRVVDDSTTTDDKAEDKADASGRIYFWEHSSVVATIPGVTRLSTTNIRAMPTFEGTLAEGTNPPRAPGEKRYSTREETAPLD